MAEYHVTTFRKSGNVILPADTCIRRTRTSAALAFRGAVYGSIRAFAGLDTQWGVSAYDAALVGSDAILDGSAASARVNVQDHTILIEKVA